jgi:hypothetical protein
MGFRRILRYLNEVMSQNFPEGAQENKHIIQDSRYPGQDSKLTSPE